MNLADLKAFVAYNMVSCLECSPALLGDEKQRILEVSVFIQTPDKQRNVELRFNTDRPFTHQAEVIQYFNLAGVPKHKIMFVYPKGSDYYRTAEEVA
jgi:hypothetical protein